jgi:hypothetical protein
VKTIITHRVYEYLDKMPILPIIYSSPPPCICLAGLTF